MPFRTFVYLCLVFTCWERADLLALVWVSYFEFVTFPIGILGQVWFLVVSIPDVRTLTYFAVITNAKMNVNCFASPFQISLANFLIVRYPTHFKELSYIYFIKKSNPNYINLLCLRSILTVSANLLLCLPSRICLM